MIVQTTNWTENSVTHPSPRCYQSHRLLSDEPKAVIIRETFHYNCQTISWYHAMKVLGMGWDETWSYIWHMNVSVHNWTCSNVVAVHY